jgi:hypothetical protein
MLHAHYLTKQVRSNGTARCMYAVYVTKEQREALFHAAPLQHNKVVLEWYDKSKREVCLRRAAAAELSEQRAHFLAPIKDRPHWDAKTKGMFVTSFTTNGRNGEAVDLSFLFAQRKAANVRIVNVKGVPHLVWQLPTRDEVEAPRMRIENREKLYNPNENPSSDVRYVTVKQAVAEPSPTSGRFPSGDRGPNGHAEAKGTLSPLESLKINIARVNQLAAKIGGVELAIEAGKLRASVVTRVTL